MFMDPKNAKVVWPLTHIRAVRAQSQRYTGSFGPFGPCDCSEHDFTYWTWKQSLIRVDGRGADSLDPSAIRVLNMPACGIRFPSLLPIRMQLDFS